MKPSPWLPKAGHECYFYLNNAQLKTIKRMFRSEYDTYSQEFSDLFDGTLKRMPVIMKRIGMILTGFRLDMNQPLPERMVCSNDDFETLLLIGHKLLLHAAMMYQMLPKSKDATPGEIGQSLIQKQFFQMLPTDFTKQDAVKMAEVLGVNVRTMEDWLEKMIKHATIERLMKGQYHKTTRQIA